MSNRQTRLTDKVIEFTDKQKKDWQAEKTELLKNLIRKIRMMDKQTGLTD